MTQKPEHYLDYPIDSNTFIIVIENEGYDTCLAYNRHTIDSGYSTQHCLS